MKILPLYPLLLTLLISCSEKTPNSGGEKMNLYREEKLRIISDAADSGDVGQAGKIAGFLNDEDADVVGRACFNLGYLGARNYIDDTANFLSTNDRDLLILCLSGLALMVDSRDAFLAEKVLRLVDHESILVRMSAMEVLGNIRSKGASDPLIGRFDGEVPAVKYEIVKALGKIGDAGTLPLLRSYKKAVATMDHSMPRKAATRGADPQS